MCEIDRDDNNGPPIRYRANVVYQCGLELRLSGSKNYRIECWENGYWAIFPPEIPVVIDKNCYFRFVRELSPHDHSQPTKEVRVLVPTVFTEMALV